MAGDPCATFSKLPNQKMRSLTNGPPTVKPFSCLKNGARGQPLMDVRLPALLKSLSGQPSLLSAKGGAVAPAKPLLKKKSEAPRLRPRK